MKKTISILLIVTMLLSMFLAAVPMSAAESDVTDGGTTDVVDDGKTTPGHQNYEHKDAAYFEGLGLGYTKITSYEEFCAIESGSIGEIKYYYLDLSGSQSETLVMSGKDHDKFMEYIYFDFNGYSVDVSGVNNAVFGTLKACTVKNLKIVGNLRYGSDRGYYADKVSVMGKSPLTNTAYNHENNGVVHLDNVVSSVNWTISQQHGYDNKPAGGIINDAASGSTFNKCVFDGTITVANDEAFMAADSKNNLSAQPGRVGGIVGTANGCVFTDCENSGSITVADGIRFGYSNDEASVGGIVGNARGNNEFDNCKNSGDITINAKAINENSEETSGQMGGIVGYLTGASLFVDCENTGDIKINNGMHYAGGIVGNATAKATIKKSVNGGDITVTGGVIAAGGIAGRLTASGSSITDSDNTGALTVKSGATVSGYDAENNFCGLGGILGLAAESVTVENCDNTSAVTVEADTSLVSCVFGAGGVVGTVAVASEISGCTNDGAITYYPGGTGEANGVAGIVGKIYTKTEDLVTVTNCENKANGVVNTYGQPLRVSGIVGSLKYSEVKISGCKNLAAMSGYFTSADSAVGGIVGFLEQGTDMFYNVTVENCSNAGEITFNSQDNRRTYMGGIIAKAYNPGNITILNCSNSGNILGDDATRTATGEYDMAAAGGIMGDYDEVKEGKVLTIKGCVNTGEVRDTNGVGGMLGAIHRSNGATINIEDCENYGKIYNIAGDSQYTAVGGILGMVNDWARGPVTVNVKDCINGGEVTAKYNYVGGIVGGSTKGHSSKDNHPSNEGDKVYITNCINAGALSLTSTSGSGHPRAIGGIVGYATIGQYFVDGCISVGAVCAQQSGFERGPIAGGTNATVTDTVYLEGAFSGDAVNDAGTAVSEADAIRAVELSKNLIDKEALLAELADIEANFVSDRYVPESWAPLAAAIAYAEEVVAVKVFTVENGVVTFADDEQLQADIDKAYSDILSVMRGLELNADSLDALDKAIAAADKFCADNADKVYTTETWTKYVATLNFVKDIRNNPANLSDPLVAIEMLQARQGELVLGGDIVSGADFAKLEGQSGVFYLTNNITVTAPVNSFKGKLYGNGYTITLDGCALFGELNGAEIYDLNLAGDAGEAYSLFGKAVGTVKAEDIKVDTTKLAVATFFDLAAEDAAVHIYDVISTSDAGVAALVGNVNCAVYVSNALVMADAPALVGTVDADASAIELAYVDGKVFVDANGSEITDADVFASGAVAYAINRAFGEHLLGQKLGDDALPILEAAANDGLNVVIAVFDENGEITGYDNEGHKYVDDEFVIPSEPEAEPPKAIDLTKLNAAIAAAEALEESKYTADSWNIVKSLLNSAKAALSATEQIAADIAADSLTAAVTALVEKVVVEVVPVDYSKLEAAIAKASTMRSVDYSAGTWGTLQTMLAYAKIAMTATTQVEVDQALAGLESAITTLKAPEAVEETPSTDAPATEIPAPADEGCGSVIGGAAVILTAVVALGAGITFKKKED